ncbi:coxsackievirus and adenovirus receptor-like [Betta splendens]|uniref:Coxsackievirus and adenovirus receptor-like n=1 Tax=Betta splendens TaxID=158456 RepID=A0A9W2XTP8_BETSP|nr:coxsackievirus and adenovirus receptor-like [Betta splendens]
MQLLPLSLCLLTLTGSTFSDVNVAEIIRVTEGDEATLPCFINKSIEFERFEWKKDRKKKVSLYEGVQLSGQDDQFRGRVSHFDDELKNGDASITISDTKVSDSGFYTCNFPNLHQTFTVRLVVGPVIVRVKEGDNGILPCKINKDISFELFEWIKDGKKDVYLHEGKPLSGQDEEFKGRVSHFDHKLKNGDASITISDTKVSDIGDYTCDFPDLKTKQTSTVRLVVGKAAKVSILKPEQTEDGFLLQCLVSDVSPGFKLNISWFDGSGNKLIEQKSNTESEKLHILQTTVKKSDTYRCVATMEELSHQVHSEVHVQIPESKIPLIVGLVCLAVMALIIVAWAGVIYKNRKKMKRKFNVFSSL